MNSAPSSSPYRPSSPSTRIGIAAWVVWGAMLSTGCHMTAPMHVWKKPQLARGGSVRVAVAQVGGDIEVAERLQQALVVAQPKSNQRLAVVHPDQLERLGGIQLASYDGQPSEMAALGAARRVGAQYVLAGHIVQHDLVPPEPVKRRWYQLFPKPPKTESMTVRWVVYDVSTFGKVGENQVTIDRKQAEREYPDLAFQASGDIKVIAASARRSWESVLPTTHTTDAMLDLPWLMPGSSRVRKGNAYARLGRWEEAEREWQEAAAQHPWNRAAWTNLSLAAVAREDFALARDRLEHAQTQLWPGDETEEAKVWIEQQQRAYHEAFELPPPAEGWSYPDPVVPTAESVGAPVTKDEVVSAPKSLDDQPWYTVLPFVPPPGWTWSSWWNQSFLW
jgi:tetratricopeptide (TPR) repeat protein